MNRRHLRKITLGLVGSLMMTSSVYGTELYSTNNQIIDSEESTVVTLLDSQLVQVENDRLATVNANLLNVRAVPSLNGEKISQLTLGEEVHVIKQEGDWYFITNGDVEGFVFGEYLAFEEESQSATLGRQDIHLEGTISAELAEVMSVPSEEGQRLAEFNVGQAIEVLSQHDEWYLVSYEDIKGYVHGSMLTITTEELVTSTEVAFEKYAIVNTGILNVRNSPDLDASVVGKTYRNNQLEVTDVLDEWVEIEQTDGSIGYVYRTYVTLTNEPLPVVETTEIRQQIIDYAKQFLGNPYRYGGNSLTEGTDCSGFTKLVFQNFGYNITRTSRSQINEGVRISKSQLQPGDLVFYGYNNYISHVAIYIGQDQIIHANTPSTGIIISNINIGKPYIGATSIIN